MPNCPHCNNPIDIKLFRAATIAEIRSLLDAIGDPKALEGEERDFVQKVRYRIDTYGDRTRVTGPQREWLEKIAGKITGHDLPL